MIKLSKIDEELSIYKNNTVVFLGLNNDTHQLFCLFQQNNIEPDYICDNNPSSIRNLFNGISFISAKQLKGLVNNQQKTGGGGQIIVQFSTKNVDKSTEEQLQSIGIDTVISYDEAISVLFYKIKKERFKLNPFLKEDYFAQSEIGSKKGQYKINEFATNSIYYSHLLFICMPPKTGDHTLRATFNKHNIPCYFTTHGTVGLEKIIAMDLNKKIKITTAVRDPISTSISLLYQDFGGLHYTETICRFDLDQKSWIIDGGNVQDVYDEHYNYNNTYSSSFPSFMERFKKSILDLSKYEFDKEKGYTIVKEGNIEIFVYQLEKINDIVKEMSDWIGANPFDKWTISNDASSKWIASSYKQAQKELQFSKEFFDRCYNNSWVEHFYSQEDIEKFKARWIGQVMD